MSQALALNLMNGTEKNILYYNQTNQVQLQIIATLAVMIPITGSISLYIDGYFTDAEIAQWEFTSPDWSFQWDDANSQWNMMPNKTINLTAGIPYSINISIVVGGSSAGTQAELHALCKNIPEVLPFATPVQIFLNTKGSSANLQDYIDCIFIQPSPPTMLAAEVRESSGILPQVITSADPNNIFMNNQLAFSLVSNGQPPTSIQAGPNTKFIVTFLYDETSSQALTTVELASNSSYFQLTAGDAGENWTITPQLDTQNPSWILQPVNGQTIIPNQNVTFIFNNVVTTLPSGLTGMYIYYQNIEGYDDGVFPLLQIQKQPQVNIISFSADPTNISGEGDATLSWDVSGVDFSAGGIGITPDTGVVITNPQGSQQIPITESTTFTLTAYGVPPTSVIAANVATKTLQVSFKPSVTSFTGSLVFEDAMNISLALQWKTKGASYVQISGYSNDLSASSSFTVKNLSLAQTYSITAFNSAGDNCQSSGLNVGYSKSETPYIRVSGSATGLAITPDGSKLLACVKNPNNTGNVTIVNIETLQALPNTIQVGNGPGAIEITPNGQFTFVLNITDNTISVINNVPSLQVTKTISLGNSYQLQSMAMSPDGKYIFVSGCSYSSGNGNVAVINIHSLQVIKNISISGFPSQMAITPDSQYAFILNSQNATQININNLDAAPVTILSGLTCSAIAVTPNNQYVIVALTTASYTYEAQIFNVNNLASPIQTIELGSRPLFIEITPDSQYAILVTQTCSPIMLDLNTFQTFSTNISYGNTGAHCIAISSNGQYIFVGTGQIFVNQLMVLPS